MTVAELIKQLSECPQDAVVIIYNPWADDWDTFEIVDHYEEENWVKLTG